MLESTSKFQVKEIIYNKDGFAIATGYWDGNKSALGLGCRWHEDGGLGYPQTYGKPQWMKLPDCTVSIANILDLQSTSITLTFK